MGVIAKRPIANAAWLHKSRPENSYYVPYWERFHQLGYDFLNGDTKAAVARALRFTLTAPGVHTAIVGTTKPARWKENAALIASGNLPDGEFEAIRQAWKKAAQTDWTGQV